ncbi:hypothetical protein GCM10027280_45670 [Micromonospora polyrhachis]|uniref:Uncharacterized protein n=1 Tax=Micromonospora polyrhachis TaxID=1282883 RepID=A0A7W7SQ78_9ACTN|nr:hypothetical protein [Micromonospora polyrhachis]MBB4958919.1 hypothetical protein [Micromonospora polyrhachis]
MTQPHSPYDLGDVPALVANLGPAPTPTVTNGIHVGPASIAVALERAAADLRAMGDVSIAPTWVTLSLQVVQRPTSVTADRFATVDRLSKALVGEAGEHGKSSYGVPYRWTDARGDLICQVYTNPGEVDQ